MSDFAPTPEDIALVECMAELSGAGIPFESWGIKPERILSLAERIESSLPPGQPAEPDSRWVIMSEGERLADLAGRMVEQTGGE